jgi:hypothetical protein
MFDDVLQGRIELDIEIAHFEWPQSVAERPSCDVLANVAEGRKVRLQESHREGPESAPKPPFNW